MATKAHAERDTMARETVTLRQLAEDYLDRAHIDDCDCDECVLLRGVLAILDELVALRAANERLRETLAKCQQGR